MRRPSPGVAFAALCVVCLVVGVGYLGFARVRAGAAAERMAVGAPGASAGSGTAVPSDRSLLMFRNLAPGDGYGKLSFASLEAPDGERTTTPLSCDRLYFSAGRGLCLSSNTTGIWSPPTARAFDAQLRLGASFPVGELPSRARVAADGRHAAMTGFVRGDSYNAAGFSTRTSLMDLTNGTAIADLEQFTVWRDGAQLRAVDFNFWGITFARDANRFYATLATGGRTHLVEGDVAARSLRVLRDNVECPSLSPDNHRIVFKKRIDDESWRLHVLDLDTMAEIPLAEERTVDDQAEWLDDDNVLYGLAERTGAGTVSTNVWVVPVAGTAPPRVFARLADSPSVVRPWGGT
jgi:hypothetical protein